MTKNSSLRSIYCLAVLTIIGDTAIILRFSGNTANDLIGIVAAVVAAALLGLVVKTAACVGGLRAKTIYVKKICFGAGALLLSLSAVLTAYNFSQYAAAVMLKGVKSAVPFIIFGGLFVFAGTKKKNTLLKLSAVLAAPTVLLIALMFSFSAQFMSLKYLIPYKEPTFGGVISAFMKVFPTLAFSSLVLSGLGERVKRLHFLGFFGIGAFFILLCVINVLGIFGSEFASTLRFPYSEAVSTASLGHVFSRLDGMLYAVCFFTCGVKVSASVWVALRFIRKIL